LSEDTVFCNTHLGVIAALRASDGRVRWLCEYPRVSLENDNPDRNVQHLFRDITPCLAYRDLVIAAPSDCNRLFALDAGTGHVIWTLLPEQAADVIHLLGVGGDRLVASGDYLYWLDVYTGRIVGQFPPPRVTTPGHARPSPRGHGRGVLVGDKVYWPTRDSILVFGQRTVRTESGVEPHLVREIELTPRGATGGNLVVAGDVLIIAATDQLFVFDRYGKRNTDEKR
jgi:outer membrane protein assembly factor BamB